MTTHELAYGDNPPKRFVGDASVDRLEDHERRIAEIERRLDALSTT